MFFHQKSRHIHKNNNKSTSSHFPTLPSTSSLLWSSVSGVYINNLNDGCNSSAEHQNVHEQMQSMIGKRFGESNVLSHTALDWRVKCHKQQPLSCQSSPLTIHVCWLFWMSNVIPWGNAWNYKLTTFVYMRM